MLYLYKINNMGKNIKILDIKVNAERVDGIKKIKKVLDIGLLEAKILYDELTNGWFIGKEYEPYSDEYTQLFILETQTNLIKIEKENVLSISEIIDNDNYLEALKWLENLNEKERGYFNIVANKMFVPVG